ncbi:tetratricopeptide repeat protein [Amylibacter sp. SFDW26]|uniref:tetratricopeptide repeat protein n=1 Tax=Amylibacter sp. SFDW26 TaxID=2652722 RepID=UPI001261C469|nr:tetratricopeptide repeat protein [Amylibacter sp. SFDW26]KAB7613468.1 tetratricopeptide repeat protein [Amylibacter sp. SFDW26]
MTSLLLFLCASCTQDNSNTLNVSEKHNNTNIDAARIDEAVDGLIVGHRLMAAGEYELALKAYIRAANTKGLNADVLSALGSANLKLGRLGQAKKLLKKAVEKDEEFVPAWNNLAIVLSSEGNLQEARRAFQLAFGLDNGESEEIRKNLTKVIAKIEKTSYDAPNKNNNEFDLVRRGNGRYLLLRTAKDE